MRLNSRRELRPFEKGELNVLQSTAADGHAYLRHPEVQNDSNPLFVTGFCPAALFQVSHALLQRPEPTKEVGADGPFREVEVGGDLLWAQPLVEAKCYSRPVLIW